MRKIANAAASVCMAGAVGLTLTPAPATSQGATAVELKTSHEGNIHYPQMNDDGTKVAYEVNYPAEKRTELYWSGMTPRALSGSPELLVPESMGAPSRYGGGGKRITHMFSFAKSGSQYPYAYTVNNAEGVQQIYINNWPYLIDKEADSVNKEPAWDPTSERFVFTSNRTGNGDLYLWDAAQGGEPLQLTFDEVHAELYPNWAPDGSKVAFVAAGKGESQVMVLDVNLFSSVKITNMSGADSTRPSFSPDGSRIAFLSNKGMSSVQEFSLWVTDARPGSTARKIGDKVKLPSKGAPSWTPDGKGVIAVVDDPDQSDPIAIFPVDGGAPRVLPTGTVNNRDPQMKVIDGTWRMVFTSQGLDAKAEKEFYKLFVYDIPR